MAYQVILVENDPTMLENMVNVLKTSKEFNLAATYKNISAATGQSSIFRPDLFLIDVDLPDSLNNIPIFVDIFPDANILGIMSLWDSEVAEKVTKAGALGCLLKPFNEKDVIDALELYKKRGRPGSSSVISFFSPKGRAGRTTAAALLAMLIAEKSGERVTMIDADLQFGDLPIFFDLEPKQTVVEAAQDVKMLNPLNFMPYFHKIKQDLYLLSSPDRPEYAELVESKNLVDVVRLSCNLFKYVLIDLPAGFNPISIEMIHLSKTVILMAMINNGFEIQHMKRAFEVLRSRETTNQKLYAAFTRVNPCNEDERRKLELKLGHPVSYILPNEYKMISLANSGRLIKGFPKESLLMKNLNTIAEEIISTNR